MGAPQWLTDSATTAAAVTTILGCVALVLRIALRWPLVRRAVGWLRDGFAEDRAERLDKTLAFNGTGSFRADMRELYAQVGRIEQRVSRLEEPDA